MCQLIVLMASILHTTSALHVSGHWHSDQFFKFLGKFGFQQTNKQDLTGTQGYIYGNVTSQHNITGQMVLVVLDSEYFTEFFGNRLLRRAKACPAMFEKIDKIMWDERCNKVGFEDFLRVIPCRRNELCEEEKNDPSQVIAGHQFTYHVRDTYQPRFWYISLVSCHRNSSCAWLYKSQMSYVISYDIWMVNGHPDQRHNSPMQHQFSYDIQGILELFIVYTVAYSLLLPVQVYALNVQRHNLPMLLTCCLAAEYCGVFLCLIHYAKFSVDGDGLNSLHLAGSFIDTTAQCLFMLLLLLIAKGWTITAHRLDEFSKLFLFTVWSAYSAASVALFLWNQVEIDHISDIDEWQTWPGRLILVFRLAIMLWFLLELKTTFLIETSMKKTQFYLHFGAGFLVWFVYLPLVAFICAWLSALNRYKTITCVSYSADFLSLCVLVHLLWPTRSYFYFNLDRLETRVNLDDLGYSGISLMNEATDMSDDDSDVLYESSVTSTIHHVTSTDSSHVTDVSQQNGQHSVT